MNLRATPLPRPIALVAAIAIAAASAGCGSSSGGDTTTRPGVPTGQAETSAGNYSGSEATPPKPAPALALNNSLGEPVNLAQYKGKAVLLTFIYTHCPDICPLIVSHLKTAQAQLGAKAKGCR